MVLENKLNITDSTELARMEEKISKKKAVELFENGYLNKYKAGSFEILAAIHKYLFGEIYDFAGKVRNVNIAKGNFRFAPVMYLQAAIENIEKMPQSTFDEIVEKYVEMNIAHPFREGNGRSTRIWLDLILKKELNKVIDWSLVDKEDYLLAMERSPIRDIEIKYILKQALTDKVNDRGAPARRLIHHTVGDSLRGGIVGTLYIRVVIRGFDVEDGGFAVVAAFGDLPASGGSGIIRAYRAFEHDHRVLVGGAARRQIGQ